MTRSREESSRGVTPTAPIPERPRPVRGRLLLAGATAVAAAVAGAGALYHQGIEDVLFHKPTAQEAGLADVYNQSFHTTGTKVICASAEHVSSIEPFTGAKYGTRQAVRGMPYTHTIWLDQYTCNYLDTIKSAGGIEKSEIDPQDPAYDERQSWVLKMVLGDVAHEGAHAILNKVSESDAECAAFQEAPEVAVTLGMNPELKETLRHEMIAYQEGAHAELTDAPQYRFDQGVCRDGGKGDLNPGRPGEFPTAP